jgi:photosystem II stability/assembly factor-like uncharacterized protein
MKIKLILLLLIFSSADQMFSQTFQWRLLTGSPGTTGSNRFEDVYFINANTGWIVDFGGATYKTTNAGVNWNLFNNITFNRSVGYFDAQTGLIGTLDSARCLYRTTNGGVNYTLITNLPSPKPKGICGISIVNENIAYGCGTYYDYARIIKTTNKGANWSVVFSDTSLARTLIDCYFWTPDSGIAVGGYNTFDFNTGNAVILKTTNGGISWQRVCKTTRTGEWCWKISFISRDIGYVSIERESGFAYILKTTNNGNNWTEIPFRNYDEEGIGFLNENTGWVGGWTGPTYQTTNGGANWSLAGWGTNVNRFRFLSDTLAYSVGDRVYKYSRGPVGVQNISDIVPEKFSLEQNYPNPFNPVTHLKFGISNLGFVSLKVYNVLGKEVRTLVNENKSPGIYEVEFDGGDLPSGIYLYKLETDKFSEVKKMLLLK